jgi:hypothetical protein
MFIIALLLWFGYSLGTSPPEEVPREYLDRFTMGQLIPVESYYVDDSNEGKGTHYKYPFSYITRMIEETIPQQVQFLRDRNFAPNAKEESGPSMASLFEDRKGWQERLEALFMTVIHKNYWPLTAMLHHAHLFRGAKVAVFGSVDPYYEAIALYLGAEEVTTFEYNKLTFGNGENDKNGEDSHPLDVVCGDRYTAMIAAASTNGDDSNNDDSTNADLEHYRGHFDIALSLSSFDHSGLGRYGDTIDPDADLAAMAFVRTVLKNENGRLFLTIPIGPDVVVWNLQRRYGQQRLPLLLNAFFRPVSAGSTEKMCDTADNEGSVLSPFDIVTIGWKEIKLTQSADYRKTYEPILLLNV